MSLELLIENFLKYLKLEKNRSRKTLENYQHYLSRFSNWLKFEFFKGSKFSIKDITPEAISKFKFYLKNYRDKKENPLQKKTQNYHLIALREFFRYLKERHIKSLPAEEIKLEREEESPIEFLGEEEIAKIISNFPWQDSLKHLRDRALLEVLINTGFRVSEVSSLNRDQIDFEENKIKETFLPPQVITALRNYLNLRQDKDPALFIRISRANPLLLTRRRGRGVKPKRKQSENLRLTPRSIQRIIRYLAIKSGIMKKVTPKSFRHFLALKTYLASGKPEAVKERLGLKSLTAARLYKNYVRQAKT